MYKLKYKIIQYLTVLLLFCPFDAIASQLGSDIIADSMTVNSGDNLDTNGYDLDIGGAVTVNGTLDATDDGGGGEEGDETAINLEGSFTFNSGATFTQDQSTVTFDGTTGTIDIISNGSAFYNLTLNDAGGSAAFEVNGALDIDGVFTLTDGTFDLGTNDPAANFAGNVTINGGSITAGSGVVTFDGDLTYIDNTSPKQNLGAVVIDVY